MKGKSFPKIGGLACEPAEQSKLPEYSAHGGPSGVKLHLYAGTQGARGPPEGNQGHMTCLGSCNRGMYCSLYPLSEKRKRKKIFQHLETKRHASKQCVDKKKMSQSHKENTNNTTHKQRWEVRGWRGRRWHGSWMVMDETSSVSETTGKNQCRHEFCHTVGRHGRPAREAEAGWVLRGTVSRWKTEIESGEKLQGVLTRKALVEYPEDPARSWWRWRRAQAAVWCWAVPCPYAPVSPALSLVSGHFKFNNARKVLCKSGPLYASAED